MLTDIRATLRNLSADLAVENPERAELIDLHDQNRPDGGPRAMGPWSAT